MNSPDDNGWHEQPINMTGDTPFLAPKSLPASETAPWTPKSSARSVSHMKYEAGDRKKVHMAPIKAAQRSNRRDSSDDDSNEYDWVEKEEIDSEGTIAPVPSSNFPNTWSNAYADASTAATQVGKASKAWYKSVAGSGVAKAGWSIGGALAATANRGALTAVSYAVDATGADKQRLPGPVKSWLKGKEKMDEAKIRAKEAEERRLERKYKHKLIESGEVVDALSRVPSHAGSRSWEGGWTAHAHDRSSNIFKPLDTPGTVRRQLQEPFLRSVEEETVYGGMPSPSLGSFRASPAAPDNEVSPYSDKPYSGFGEPQLHSPSPALEEEVQDEEGENTRLVDMSEDDNMVRD
ncbi:hypothetical protein EJ04DRAFT_554512 [Polyplosphaeria fusca]|uniref:Uncharacterized protein n=1 Tax=Polyplosphaeria fusca TaxID=682080 RepID=A0A9P4QQC5_9PLEO|nr:hypothetical protein EJ04DRAFT_554512 [Polyplosphaeria fusca]